MDQRPDPSGTSPEREDVTTRGCILLQLMGPMLMILTALDEQGVPLNAPNEELGHNAPALHRAETKSEARRNRGESEDQGIAVERPSAPEQISGDDYLGEGGRGTGKSGKFKGECPCRSTTLVRTDLR